MGKRVMRLPSLREGYAGELISSSGNERGWTAAMLGAALCVRTKVLISSPATKKNPRGGVGPFFENGAGDEIRTHDINLGKVALYP